MAVGKITTFMLLLLLFINHVSADTKIAFKAQVIDPNTSFSTVPIGFSNKRRILLKTNDNSNPVVETYSVREPDGALVSLSAFSGSTDTPLNMNLAGEILFAPKSDNSNICSVTIFTADAQLTTVTLPSGLPCNSTDGRLGKNGEFALILKDNQSNSSQTKHLLLYSGGVFASRMFLGSSPGARDSAEHLAGFRKKGVVTNYVTGSTTPDFEKIILHINGTSQTISTKSELPTPYSLVKILRYAGDDNVLLHDGLNVCNTYVGQLSGLRLMNVKRIRAGSCIISSDVNKNGVVAGLAAKPFIWNRKDRFQAIAPLIKPKTEFDWRSIDFINDRGDIVGEILAEGERSQVVLLTRSN